MSHPARSPVGIIPLVVAAVMAGPVDAQPGQSPSPAVAVDPMTLVLDAFRSHPIVALGEGQHWNEQGHALRLAMIRDPRFAETVDDIVVEFGNARYQDLMDRFVAGEHVPADSLRRVWENTTQPNAVWDMPIYEEFYRAVRAVNASRPASRRLRVLLGDPPIDWDVVRGKDDILPWMAVRDSFAVDVIRQQVLAKRRRALLIFGDGHLWRQGDEPNTVARLERAAPGTVFTIGTPTSANLAAIQADVATWPVPSMARLPGTVLGAAPFGPLYDVQGAPWDSLRMEAQFDALLYLGPPEAITLSRLSPARCADAAYLRMRLGRLAMVPWGQPEIDRMKRLCAGDA